MAEAEDRIRIVGAQAAFERRLLEKQREGWQVAIVNFTPANITPGYINPDNVEVDPASGLARMKPGKTLPEGLMSAEKAADPQQLATVAERAVTVNALVKGGAKLTVLTPNTGKPFADKSGRQVQPDKGSLMAAPGGGGALVLRISDRLYSSTENVIVPAASYYARNPKTGEELYGAVFATQVNAPNKPGVSFASFLEEQPNMARFHAEELDRRILKPLNLPTIEEMAGKERGAGISSPNR